MRRLILAAVCSVLAGQAFAQGNAAGGSQGGGPGQGGGPAAPISVFTIWQDQAAKGKPMTPMDNLMSQTAQPPREAARR